MIAHKDDAGVITYYGATSSVGAIVKSNIIMVEYLERW